MEMRFAGLPWWVPWPRDSTKVMSAGLMQEDMTAWMKERHWRGPSEWTMEWELVMLPVAILRMMPCMRLQSRSMLVEEPEDSKVCSVSMAVG